ncbi:unnamed protein product [Ascophyllum nodosum]
MLTKIILVSISALCLAFAHPHCHYDEREVDLEREMTFCSMDYASEGVCCTELEEAALNATYTAVVNGLTTECADYYKQLLCGVCGSYSGHLYERLADDLGSDDGLTMKSEFCTGLTTACDSQITFPDYDGEDYCTMHTGGGDDLWWSYPYERTGIFNGSFIELFPDLPDSDIPDTPLAMHQSPDSSMYWISGQEGMLVKVDADSMSSSSTVMDLSGGIFYSSFEEGLMDFAFSPMFDTNNFFYVSWTVDDSYVKNRLSKFQYYTGDPDATRDSEEVLLESAERTRFLHNGGWVGFKPSDYSTTADYHDLYWAVGDAGPQEDPFGHGQSTDILFGSIVRVSVPSDGTGYEVPSDNYPGAELPEICAIGFRNPWRCGFDSLTDELYCGNVGHINIESVYKIECGNNYGWARFEGSRCTEYSEDDYGSCVDADRSGFTFPVFEYCHPDYFSSSSSEDDYTNGIDICGDRNVIGSSVTGGYVYRGQAYADLIYGAYVFADVTLRNIFYILEQDDGTWSSGTIISDSSVVVYSFSEDMDGELFIIDEESKIYYLPCGDLCGDYDDSDDDTTTLEYTYLGCYADSVDRVLTGDSTSDSQDMTTELCAEFCEGSTYFGTEFRRECYCGEATDDPTSLGSATCSMSCTGDSTQTCGGTFAVSLYEFTV